MSKRKLLLIAQLIVSVVAIVLVFTKYWQFAVAWSLLQGILLIYQKNKKGEKA